VETVELMERGQIDEFLHELLGHEVARDIEVDTAPREPRHVFDRDGGHGPRHTFDRRLPEDLSREQLAQRLDCIECPAGRYARIVARVGVTSRR